MREGLATHRLEGECRTFLQLHRTTSPKERACGGVGKHLESTVHVPLQLVARYDLRSVDEGRRVAVANPDDVEQCLRSFPFRHRARVVDLVHIEVNGTKPEAAAEQNAEWDNQRACSRNSAPFRTAGGHR